MTVIFVQTNLPDFDGALFIGRTLVEERLVAGFNLGAMMESGYRWKGEIVRRCEWPLVLKTRDGLFHAVARRIVELHPYKTPAITASIPDRVSDDYAAWIAEATMSPDR